MAHIDTDSLDGRTATCLVARFEDGTIDLSGFHHREHLTVATWLLLHHPFDRALERMRQGLQTLLQRSGKTQGYDEIVTVSWMRALSGRLAECAPESSLDSRLNDVVRWALETRPVRAVQQAQDERTSYVGPSLSSGNQISDTLAPSPEARASSDSTEE